MLLFWNTWGDIGKPLVNIFQLWMLLNKELLWLHSLLRFIQTHRFKLHKLVINVLRFLLLNVQSSSALFSVVDMWRECGFVAEMMGPVSKNRLQKQHWARPLRFSSLLPSCLSYQTYQSTSYYDLPFLFNNNLQHFIISYLLFKIGTDNHKLGRGETD